ncbi:MAG TPA: hypothetical protein VFA45_25800 [Actinomycetes bacterium]|jgi:hypothetical protein|nr:hypothetical protein [Actinomycetes bacterium]
MVIPLKSGKGLRELPELPDDPPRQMLDIVHVIGRPVRSRGTVLVQIAEQADHRGMTEGDLRSSLRGPGLLEPQDVAGLGARVVIVQGAPVGARIRLDTERRDTTDLRSWAGQVFRASDGAVILLPSVHPELAELVLDPIARRVRWRITPEALRGATRAARARISSWNPPSHPGDAPGGVARADGWRERQTELALDVCLFERRSR